MDALKWILTGFIFHCACFSNAAYADWTNSSQYTQVYSLTGGIGVASAGKSQTLYPVKTENVPVFVVNPDGQEVLAGFTPTQIPYQNTYRADKKANMFGQGELYLALQWPFNHYFLSQLGVAFGGAGDADLQGTIDVNSIPSGSHYAYKISHGFVGIRGKLISTASVATLQPYLTGMVGAGFNQVHGYHTTPTISVDNSPTWYQNRTNSFVLTYALGLGVQKNINRNWNIALGYEFTDWGNSYLGDAAPSTWTGSGPRVANVFTHSALLTLTYLC